MQIAIFGGSFDPPHIGHEAIVNEALMSLDIDKLFVIPTFLNPFKSCSLISASQRLDLIKKLFSNEKKVVTCQYEIDQNRAVSTIETVEYMIKKYSPTKVYLIVGADNFNTIHTWNNYEKLKTLVEFVVAKRHCTTGSFDNIKLLDISVNISSTTLRHSLDMEYIPKIIQKDVDKIWHQKRA